MRAIADRVLFRLEIAIEAIARRVRVLRIRLQPPAKNPATVADWDKAMRAAAFPQQKDFLERPHPFLRVKR